MRLYIRDRNPPVPIRSAGECDLDTESDNDVTFATIIGLITPVLVWAIPNKKAA